MKLDSRTRQLMIIALALLVVFGATTFATPGTSALGPTAQYTPTIPPGVTGGFHVVVVDHTNPTAPPRANNTYATNGPHGNAQLDAMNSFLAPFVTDENSRVFNRRTDAVTDPEPNPAAGQ